MWIHLEIGWVEARKYTFPRHLQLTQKEEGSQARSLEVLGLRSWATKECDSDLEVYLNKLMSKKVGKDVRELVKDSDHWEQLMSPD